ncbi:MAG TPA: double zinc ribbon domain-containing protein [Gemmatimonadaceae bacterium]|nr:double zinc ribbon domain-containing protein [Gemmatimonadaceae bacterium]
MARDALTGVARDAARDALTGVARDAAARAALKDVVPALRRGGAALMDLLLPRVCVVCARALRPVEQGLVCGMCWLRAQSLPEPRCRRCGHPLQVDRRTAACAWCDTLPPFVRAVRSACAMPGGSAEIIVHALKYEGWPAVAPAMAHRMARLAFPDDVERERAALVPVPLAPTRLRERGYNQSAELARALAPLWGVPVRDDLLERTRATRTQTRLTPGERSRNVAGAFRARADRTSLRGLHLVLVDDVVTTCATLNACATALHAGGARILSYVTFGRAPALGDRW